MFASGPALFEPSAEEEDGQHAHGGGDDSDNSKTAITSNLSSSTSKERILPGLNGYLYKISENTMDNGDDADDQEQAIQELFPAKDVVDFPISACPENASSTDDKQQQQEGCGVIIGSKQTTIFALDPTTGKVRWTQDPHGGAGGRGFTAHPPKANAARGRTVLLQREDYAVRHLDADRGHEVWKIKLGQFSPLGFDVDDESMNGNDFLFTSESSAAALTFGQVCIK
jgi:outer membrane protein assembly factor BamB